MFKIIFTAEENIYLYNIENVYLKLKFGTDYFFFFL